MKNKVVAEVINKTKRVNYRDSVNYGKINGYETLVLKFKPNFMVTDHVRFTNVLLSKVHDFMLRNGINIKDKGMRLMVEIRRDGIVSLSMGHGQLAATSPHDWLTPAISWQPVVGEKPPFFTACDEAVRMMKSSVGPVRFGDKVVNLNNQLVWFNNQLPLKDKIFAVEDGNPKARLHYLVLSTGKQATFIDQDVSHAHWFEIIRVMSYIMATAVSKVPYDLPPNNRVVRFISNIGQGFQSVPVAHMHLMIDREFPSISPESYGWEILGNNTANIRDRDGFMSIISRYSKGTSLEGLDAELRVFARKDQNLK